MSSKPIIPPELAADILKVVDEYIINDVICVAAKEVTPEEIREKFRAEQLKLNPTISVKVQDGRETTQL